MYQKILVPLDGSQRAEKMLPFVEELAQKFGSQLVLLQVVEPMVTVVAPYDAVPIYYSEELERRTQEAKNYLAGLEKRFTEKGITVKTVVESSPVVSCIIDVAEEEQVDLIAIASHGRTGLARVFYGSVAAGVLQRADRPLLVIRAHEE